VLFRSREDHAGAAALGLEALNCRTNRELEDVVREKDANVIAAHEMTRERQRVRNAGRALLVGVVEVLEAECAAVAQKWEELSGVVAAGHDEDPVDEIGRAHV